MGGNVSLAQHKDWKQGKCLCIFKDRFSSQLFKRRDGSDWRQQNGNNHNMNDICWVSQTHLWRSGPCSECWWGHCPQTLLSGWRSSVHSRSGTSARWFRRLHSCSYRHRLPACSSCPRPFWCTPARSHSDELRRGAHHTALPPQQRTPSSNHRNPAESQQGSPPPGEEHTELGHRVHSPDLLGLGLIALGGSRGPTEPEPEPERR